MSKDPIILKRTARVWVEDGRVLIEREGEEIVVMTPEVAIELGRLISAAGAEALINKVMQDNPTIAQP